MSEGPSDDFLRIVDPPGPPPVPPDVRDLWRTAFWLLVFSPFPLVVGLYTFVAYSATQFPRLAAGLLVGLGLLLLGVGAYELYSARVWRARLHSQGIEWKPETSVLPVVRSTLRVAMEPTAALGMAFRALRDSEALTEGDIRFSGVKQTPGGIEAYSGPTLLWMLLTSRAAYPSMPATIRIAAKGVGSSTDLEVRVWPYSSAQGDRIIADVRDAIRLELGGARVPD